MRTLDLPTPALILDRSRLVANCRRMSARVRGAGLALRPHLKTAKSDRVAAVATAGFSGGITVSTLAEADYFLDRGIADMTYAVCVVPAKLDRVATLQARGARLGLVTDDLAVAHAIAAAAPRYDQPLHVYVEVDCGDARTGVGPDGDALLAIARALNDAANVELAGVLTHGGQSYACRGVAEVARVAEEERAAVVRAAERLRAAGLPCPVVSAGSTPTAVQAPRFDGLTELRPGVYMFGDLAQYGRGSCRIEDLALSVLATVIGHRRERNRLLIDAGGLALSKDTSAGDVIPDAGYGWVVNATSGARIGDLRVAAVDQEHGFVEGSSIPWDRLPIGAIVRVLPNHACMTAAAHDRYQVVEGGEVVEVWDRARGW